MSLHISTVNSSLRVSEMKLTISALYRLQILSSTRLLGRSLAQIVMMNNFGRLRQDQCKSAKVHSLNQRNQWNNLTKSKASRLAMIKVSQKGQKRAPPTMLPLRPNSSLSNSRGSLQNSLAGLANSACIKVCSRKIVTSVSIVHLSMTYYVGFLVKPRLC